VKVILPETDARVVADRVRLQQILENLILNAVKYTEPEGRIEVSVESQPSDVLIRVRDTGIGIAPDKLSQVWDLFVQVDESPERTRKGLGIGLALVKDLVKRHGGSVEASSEGLGKGSTFTVRLPRARQNDVAVDTGGHPVLAVEEPAPPVESKPAVPVGIRRVLIVDDNIDAAETLGMMLEILGHETCKAHDGNAAIQAAAEYQPDIIFMDIGLPGISGHEAANRIRKDLGMTGVFMVALSGYGTEEDRRKSLHAGFDTHLVKPLDPGALPGILAAFEKRKA
jgi:CheY-like chemotaxis protein